MIKLIQLFLGCFLTVLAHSAEKDCNYDTNICVLMNVIDSASAFEHQNVSELKGSSRVLENYSSEEYKNLYTEPEAHLPTILAILDSHEIPMYYKGAILPILYCLDPKRYIEMVEFKFYGLFKAGLISEDIVLVAISEHFLVTDYYENNYKNSEYQKALKKYLDLNLSENSISTINRRLTGRGRKGSKYYREPLGFCVNH